LVPADRQAAGDLRQRGELARYCGATMIFDK
jgi:hypothetical protein